MTSYGSEETFWGNGGRGILAYNGDLRPYWVAFAGGHCREDDDAYTRAARVPFFLHCAAVVPLFTLRDCIISSSGASPHLGVPHP